VKNLITYILLLTNIIAFGQESKPSTKWIQMMEDPTISLFETKKEFDEYWTGKQIEKGKGYKQFLRWENYMFPRVYPSGDVTLPSQTSRNFIEWEKKFGSKSDEKAVVFSAWTSIGPNGKPIGSKAGAGRLNFLRFHPTIAGTMLVGTPNGGLWKTVNSGSSWTTNTGFLPSIGVADLAIHPTTPQTMYLATGDNHSFSSYSIGVYKTINGGTNWTPTAFTANVAAGLLIRKLVINPSNPQIMWAATNQGIYRTLDGFQTAPTLVQAGSFYDLELKPGTPSVVYIAGNSFMRSTNSGLNFTTIYSVIPADYNIRRIEIAISPSNVNRVYLQIGGDNNGLEGIYSSSDSGLNFLKVKDGLNPNTFGYSPTGADLGGQAHYANGLAVSPISDAVLFGGSVNIWSSINSGVNWTIKGHWDQLGGLPFVHADIHDIQFLPGSGTTLFVLNDGGIVKSTDGGTTWTDISSNLSIAQMYRIAPSATNPSMILAGHQDNGTNQANGAVWSNILGGDGMDCLIDRTNSANYIFSFQNGGYYSIIAGSYVSLNAGLPYGAGVEWLSTIQQDPVNANTIYAGGRSNLYKSPNFGGTWTQLGNIGGTGNVIEFAVSPSNPQILYVLKVGGIFKSINGGMNWTNVIGTTAVNNPPTALVPTSIAISPTNPNKIWVSYSGYNANAKVYASTNGGTSWVNLSTGLPNIPVNIIRLVPNLSDEVLAVGTDVCIYSKNGTGNWSMVSGGSMPRVAVRDIKFTGTGASLKMYAATFGRGAYTCNISNVINAPRSANEVSPYFYPAEQVLIYPNPSKGSFSIEVADEIKQIIIYDVNGNLIEHSFSFNDSTKSNIDLSFLKKGNYFLKIQTEKNSETKQIIIE
jgi:photosystem II stability/assembly factor-like uncharacterized protein